MAADHIVTVEEAAAMFEAPGIVTDKTRNGYLTWNADNGILVDDPFPLNSNRTTVLEVKHFYGQYALGKTDPAKSGVEARPSGVTAYSDGIIPNDTTEFYMAMDMAVPIGFKHNWGIHLWDLLGPYFPANTLPENLGLQLASFLQIAGPDSFLDLGGDWHVADYPGALSIYYYGGMVSQGHWYFNPLDPTDPDNNGRSRPQAEYQQLIQGQWNSIEQHVKLNTQGFTVGDPTGANGIIQAWHNGKLMVDLHDVQWINQDAIDKGYDHFTRSQFQTWYGGNEIAFACHEDQSIYFDNLVISNSRITG